MIRAARAFLYCFGVLILIGGITAFAMPLLVTEKFFLAPARLTFVAVRGSTAPAHPPATR